MESLPLIEVLLLIAIEGRLHTLLACPVWQIEASTPHLLLFLPGQMNEKCASHLFT